MTPDEYCQERTARSGTSFYYSFLFLPPERRRAITALYAFCREVDDVVDEVTDPALARTKLAWWRTEIGTTFTGTPTILHGSTKGTPFLITGSVKRNPQRLVCYSARSTTKHVKRPGLFLANQFGHQRVDTIRESELCVPSIEPAGPTPTPTVAPTPTKTPTPPGPCQTPSPTPIYGSASKAFLATSKGLLD
jgi:hypothetical protein